MRCLAWVVEKLPTQMIENPDYKAEEDIEEMEEPRESRDIEWMFKQEFCHMESNQPKESHLRGLIPNIIAVCRFMQQQI